MAHQQPNTQFVPTTPTPVTPTGCKVSVLQMDLERRARREVVKRSDSGDLSTSSPQDDDHLRWMKRQRRGDCGFLPPRTTDVDFRDYEKENFLHGGDSCYGHELTSPPPLLHRASAEARVLCLLPVQSNHQGLLLDGQEKHLVSPTVCSLRPRNLLNDFDSLDGSSRCDSACAIEGLPFMPL